jgi:hypothetical protein
LEIINTKFFGNRQQLQQILRKSSTQNSLEINNTKFFRKSSTIATNSLKIINTKFFGNRQPKILRKSSTQNSLETIYNKFFGNHQQQIL